MLLLGTRVTYFGLDMNIQDLFTLFLIFYFKIIVNIVFIISYIIFWKHETG